MIRTARTALVAASLAACLGVGALPAVGGQAALAATTATVAGLPAGIPPAALKTEPPLPKPAGWPFPEAFPRTSGTGRMAGGAFEWSDFIYDDHGAQGIQVQSPVASSSPWKGTYTYADPQADNNGADIFRTAVADDGSSTWWRVDWNTLVDRHVPIAEWALDTDGNATTGSTAWPGGAGVNSPGIDRAIIASGTGAWLVTNPATGAATDIVAKGGALLVDMQARSFMVRIPHSLLNPSGTWQVRLASGVAASDGRSFAPVDSSHGALSGQPAVYNAAFRDYTDEPAGGLNYWFENTQATALSQNDLSNFSTTIRWAQLAAKTTTPEPQPTGYTNRWYVSSIEMGQGWLPEPQQDYRPNFLGRVQPYGIYVPTNYNPSRQAWPLTWVLHSYSNGQNEYGARDPNLLHDACEVRDSICATTLGRGPDGWYLDEAELDFWEVWNRISASYRLDADRTVISGYSMGGFGTYRLALGHPDLFARALTLSGAVICGVRVAPGVDLPGTTTHCMRDGDTAPFVPNARWLPFVISRGAVDELVPIGGTTDQVSRFDAAGLRYRDVLWLAEDHLDQSARDSWFDAGPSMGQDRRTTNAGELSYAWYPDLDRPEWGVGTNGLYWLRGLSGRSKTPGTIASVDAASAARPDSPVTLHKTQSVLVPPPGSTPALVTDQTWTFGVQPTARPAIALKMTNVATAAIDLVAAGIATGRHGLVTVDTDGPNTLTLSGLGAGTVVRLDQSTVIRADRGGRAVIAFPEGHHTVEF